ncbi:hypothetical protein A4A49_53030 [Nicotiana attenuata]|uniref:Aminotransferase-like plant mobile domain-containing protein n=1 Tax=Nicotiana attenuata TaxID=49451 RepID=A0A1J6KAJ9_NICAT|nr:hypothetical protein A4A49_64767 [Nicotiana attenuata]OIT39282.1 hypothetical protein A4A49_53030 [Nicotiana attenuata]
MVVKIPRKLIKWWKMFSLLEQHELMEKLGTLTSLLDITPRLDLVEAMLTYWDQQNLVFRFEECEITPTLAEMAGLTRLSYIGRDMILPRDRSRTRFLSDLGLKDNKNLRCLKQSWISLDYLFARFGPHDSFDVFWDEFCTTKENEVRGGVRYSEGSNLLLQLWMMAHLHTASLLCLIDRALRDRVVCIECMMQSPKFTYLVGVIAWIEFLGLRTNENVLWAYLWLPLDEIVVGCRMQPFLMLIGLKCVRPYTPVREPPTLNLRRHIMNFSRKAADEIKYVQYWNNAKRMKKNTLVEDVGRPKCTQEYLIWLQSITPGVSTPLLAQLRGREVQIDDFEEASDQDPWDKIKSQLAGLVANVEQHGQYLCRVGLQEAGAHTRVFIPIIGHDGQPMTISAGGITSS